ncbi:mitochondrial import translocase, subunit Tom22 [Thozetella sp. PMI_491]|nr:mitochondrial import translocase, subunit Tom22 [Thozetella sp. PMI_491]
MVQLKEVPDEHFSNPQPGPEEDNEADFTDTDSEISEDSNFDPSSETIWDRIYELRNIVPPTTRFWLWRQGQRATNFFKTSLFFLGRSSYVIVTSALLIGVPYALAYAEEQNMIAMEREQQMREMGGELLTAGGENDAESTADRVGAAIGGSEKQGSRQQLTL